MLLLVLMVILNCVLVIEFVGVEIENDDALSWISNESSKSSRRRDVNCWVVYFIDVYVCVKVNFDMCFGICEYDVWMDVVVNEMSELLL